MNVVFFIHRYWPIVGGVEKYMQIAMRIAKEYESSDYTKQRLEKKFKGRPQIVEGNVRAIERAYTPGVATAPLLLVLALLLARRLRSARHP